MPDQIDLDRVKKELPHFPEDVIQIWLSTFVKRFGWPPYIHPGWRNVLKGSKDLEFLHSLQDWKIVELEIDPAKFSSRDQEILVGMYRTHVLGHTTAFSLMSDGRDRFDSIVNYMKENGTFPCPIVLAAHEDTYDILDGYHRMTAMMYLYGFFKGSDPNSLALNVPIRQPAWICHPSAVWW